MLLLSSGAFEHGVIEQLTAQNSSPSSLRDKAARNRYGASPQGTKTPTSGIGAIGPLLVEIACSYGGVGTADLNQRVLGSSPSAPTNFRAPHPRRAGTPPNLVRCPCQGNNGGNVYGRNGPSGSGSRKGLVTTAFGNLDEDLAGDFDFLAGFGIEISIRFWRLAPHHRSPALAMEPAGQN